jgi:hypothetical protein
VIAPARAVRHALTIITAVKHADQPGSRRSVALALIEAGDLANREALLVMAAFIARTTSDEALQALGTDMAASEGMVQL